MTIKLAILDKDGTLVRPKSGKEFVQHPDDQELLPGVENAIARLVSDRWTLAIASNQGGVAAGYKTLKDAIAEMRYCMKLIDISSLGYFCPDFEGNQLYNVTDDGFYAIHSNENAQRFVGKFRKPDPGMLQFLMHWAGTNETLMIGDRTEDEQAAIAAGIPFMRADEWRKEGQCCVCSNPADGLDGLHCQDCWERLCSASWWQMFEPGDRVEGILRHNGKRGAVAEVGKHFCSVRWDGGKRKSNIETQFLRKVRSF